MTNLSKNAPVGTKFETEKRGKLYYLNVTMPAETWHQILGHCNTNDVFKLDDVVEGSKIMTKGKPECDSYEQG